MEQCKQCETNFQGEFCPRCGQRKFTRINARYVRSEFTDSVLKMNHGFLFTLKGLLTRPGKVARDYIDGRRQMHARPFRMAVLLTVISSFIAFKLLGMSDIMLQTQYYQNTISSLDGDSGAENMKSMLSFYYNYSSVIMLLMIPSFALITKIAFYRWGQNYYEHLVINAFYFSFSTLVNILFIDLLILIFRNRPESVYVISQISLLLFPLLVFWFFKTFYIEKSAGEVLLRILALIGLLLALILVLIIIGTLAVILYFLIMGVD